MPTTDTGAGDTICMSEGAPTLLEPIVRWEMQRSKQAVVRHYGESNNGHSSWLLIRHILESGEFS